MVMVDKITQEQRLLERISEHTGRLTIHGNRVVVEEYIETPYDAFGLVDKQELFHRILGSVANFHWEGRYVGPHHIMWPRENYSGFGLGDRRNIPKQFRGSTSLKMIIPRELHDYLHKITLPPELPSVDVMVRYIREQNDVNRLYDIVRYRGLKHFDMSFEDKEVYRERRLMEELEQLPASSIGLMPDPETLAAMPFTEARQVLRSIARIQGLSNATSSQRAFFRELP